MRWIFGAILAAALVCSGTTARAQIDPRFVLQQVIVQFQAGRPDPSWYSPQLWQIFAAQTSNTMVYPMLNLLGPVQNIVLLNLNELPAGTVYIFSAQHTNGVSNWLLSIGRWVPRIEYAEAQFLPRGGLSQPDTQNTAPFGNPSPSPDQGGNPAPTPPPMLPTSQSDACRRFPNLC
ncbi:hypothetical protein [Falsiroseomonas sp. E2-1-a4]|uniref:hypothetical protein n=1 Tax=Falsiroseomonas sp. E2-1-a4 TaxID=3239299 RepID=UPI003F593126